jgi:potassium channel subfamily K
MLREQIGNYNDSSKLEFAKGHRGLMVLTITLMGYILIWAEIFAKIEGWHYLDAVYWADVTLLTVGFGDFTPETHLGRSLLIPFAAFGILLLGSVIYRITRVVFGRGRSMWELRLRDEERRKRVRKRERQRTRSKNITNEEKLKAVLQNGNGNHVQRLSKSEAIAAKKEEAREARRQDFELMREVLQRTSKKRLRYSVLIWASLTMILWIAGAAVFYGIGKGEGWTYFKAVYFTWISILAIGYGDNTLNTNFGKAFFVLWSLIVVPTLTMLISASVQAFGEPSQRGAHIKKWFQKFIRGRKPPKLEHATSRNFSSPR